MQFDNQKTRNVADVVAKILAGESAKQEPQMLGEELVGNQHKIDANKNKKIDAHDFKLLRAQKDKEKANSQKFGKDVKEEVGEIEEASKEKEEKFHMSLDKLVHKTFGHSPAEKKEKMKEEAELDEAMFPGTKEYEKKYGQSPQQKLKKKGDTVPTSQGEMKKTEKGVMHTRRFSEMLDTYREGGLKTIAEMMVKEEPDNEEFTKEMQDQKDKMDGKKKGADVAKGSVQAVKVEEEYEIIDANEINGVDQVDIEESAKETATRARVLADKLSKKDSEKSKMYRDMANQALSRISSGVGKPKQSSYRDIEGGGNKSLRRQGIEPAGKSPVFPFRKEEVELEEREMTDAEMKRREEYVKGMKKKMPGFKERYGERAKEVMYATATKMAKKD